MENQKHTVVIRKKSKEVPQDFIRNFLSVTLGIGEEEYEALKKTQDEVFISIEEDKLRKLINLAKRYESLIEVKVLFQKSSEVFRIATDIFKANLGLVLAWGTTVFILFLLSIVPVVGVVFSILSSIFLYGFTFYIADKFRRDFTGDIQEFGRNLSISDAISNYWGIGLGMWLGWVALTLVLGIFFFVLFVIAGNLGAVNGDQVKAFNTGIFTALIGLLIVGMWLIYVTPLIFVQGLKKEKVGVDVGFLSLMKVFSPSFIKESFSSNYLRTGFLWSFVFTVLTPLILLSAVFIITIPISMAIAYWLNLYLSLSASVYYINTNL